MNRLIDTMSADQLSAYLDDVGTAQDWLPYKSDAEVRQKLERLFAKEPQWFDKLDPADNQTWVLCYLSDDSPEDTCHVDWVTRKDYFYYQYEYRLKWKYATPVDLNVRFKKGESDE